VVIPTCEGEPGQPLLLSGPGIDWFEAQSEDRLSVPVLHRNGLQVSAVRVEDPGILLSAAEGSSSSAGTMPTPSNFIRVSILSVHPVNIYMKTLYTRCAGRSSFLRVSAAFL